MVGLGAVGWRVWRRGLRWRIWVLVRMVVEVVVLMETLGLDHWVVEEGLLAAPSMNLLLLDDGEVLLWSLCPFEKVGSRRPSSLVTLRCRNCSVWRVVPSETLLVQVYLSLSVLRPFSGGVNFLPSSPVQAKGFSVVAMVGLLSVSVGRHQLHSTFETYQVDILLALM